MGKRTATDMMESCSLEDRHVVFKTTSENDETIHRMRIEHHQMLLVLESVRKEKLDIISQAGQEITRLKKEKDDVIRQSVEEIMSLRRQLHGCKQVVDRVNFSMHEQKETIRYLRESLAKAESFNSSRDSFNHIGAF